MLNKPLILPIEKIIKENSRVKSFYFRYPLIAKPGQFMLVWVPGYDEKPLGVIVKDKKTFLISVAAVGKTTEHPHRLKKGDRLGFRGPYGNYFSLPRKKEGLL